LKLLRLKLNLIKFVPYFTRLQYSNNRIYPWQKTFKSWYGYMAIIQQIWFFVLIFFRKESWTTAFSPTCVARIDFIVVGVGRVKIYIYRINFRCTWVGEREHDWRLTWLYMFTWMESRNILFTWSAICIS